MLTRYENYHRFAQNRSFPLQQQKLLLCCKFIYKKENNTYTEPTVREMKMNRFLCDTQDFSLLARSTWDVPNRKSRQTIDHRFNIVELNYLSCCAVYCTYTKFEWYFRWSAWNYHGSTISIEKDNFHNNFKAIIICVLPNFLKCMAITLSW